MNGIKSDKNKLVHDYVIYSPEKDEPLQQNHVLKDVLNLNIVSKIDQQQTLKKQPTDQQKIQQNISKLDGYLSNINLKIKEPSLQNYYIGQQQVRYPPKMSYYFKSSHIVPTALDILAQMESRNKSQHRPSKIKERQSNVHFSQTNLKVYERSSQQFNHGKEKSQQYHQKQKQHSMIKPSTTENQIQMSNDWGKHDLYKYSLGVRSLQEASYKQQCLITNCQGVKQRKK